MQLNAAAKVIFKALDVDGNGRLSADEVTMQASCDGVGFIREAVTDFVGMNEDQFVSAMVNKRLPADLVVSQAQEIQDYSFNAGRRRELSFFGGLSIALGVILLPFEIVGFIMTGGSPWAFFLFGNGADNIDTAKRGTGGPEEWRASNAIAFILDVAEQKQCPVAPPPPPK